MDVVFIPNNLIWKRPQCVHILSLIMYLHTRNMYLRCYDNCTCINITYQEIDDQYSDTTPSIRFHIYHIIARCTTYGIIPLKDKKICRICKQESSSEKSTKTYTQKELVMMETTIYYFHTSFYI